MSYGSDYAQAAANIITHGGDVAADAARRKGALWAGTLNNLGQIPAQFMEQQQKAKAFAAQQQNQQQESQLRQQEIDLRRQALSQKEVPDPVTQQLNQLKLREAKVNAARSYFDGINDQETYTEALPDLRQIFGPGSEKEFPDQFQGKAWVERHKYEGSAWADKVAAERKAAEKAAEDANKPKPEPKTREIVTTENGVKVTKIVPDVAGSSYPVAPSEPPSITPYQQEELKLSRARLGLEQQRANNDQPIDIKPNTKEYRLAQDMAYGKITMADFNRMYGRAAANANLKASMYDKARELNPNFNPAAFEIGYKLASTPKTQQQLASLDNVIEATPDMIKYSDAAGRTGVGILNQLVSKAGYQVGGKQYSNFHTAQIAYADELSGALGYGSATDMSREMGFNLTDGNLSPEKYKAGLTDVVLPFIRRKRDTLLKGMGPYGEPGGSPAGDAAQQDRNKNAPVTGRVGPYTYTVK